MGKQGKTILDLEDRLVYPVRIPNHARPIQERLGDYLVETGNILEQFGIYYHLTGNLSLSKINTQIGKRKIFLFFGPEISVKKEIVEWKLVVSAGSDVRQLYHPRSLAKVVVSELRENQDIELDLQQTEQIEQVLVEALKPYVNRALHFTVDTKQYKAMGQRLPDCRLIPYF